MKRVLLAALAVALLPFFAARPLGAAEAPLPPVGAISGHTLNAVAHVPRPPGTAGGGELSRIMLQAYLRPDGRALVRVWDTARNRYTPAAERRWSLSGRTLCVDLPGGGTPGSLCADVHVWGPRIAGIGTRPYAMIDGDLQPGNAIGGPR